MGERISQKGSLAGTRGIMKEGIRDDFHDPGSRRGPGYIQRASELGIPYFRFTEDEWQAEVAESKQA
jgi:hypothetical protein